MAGAMQEPDDLQRGLDVFTPLSLRQMGKQQAYLHIPLRRHVDRFAAD